MSILVEIMRTRNPELEILCIQTAESYFDKQEIAVFQWQYHLLRVFVVLVILNSKYQKIIINQDDHVHSMEINVNTNNDENVKFKQK